MSLSSMTGFGSASTASGAWTVDVRSVNGRFLDIHLKLPDEWRALEPALRERVSRRVRRGKVELRVGAAAPAPGLSGEPSAAALERLARTQSVVRQHLPEARPLSVHETLTWCRMAGAPDPEPDDGLLQAADAAVAALLDTRQREGARLAESLRERLLSLRHSVALARPLVAPTVQRQQERFLQRWRDALGSAGGPPGAEAAQDRALAEAAAYALRIDVAEELERLGGHLAEIDELIAHGAEVGKRLDFLIQELHREANTLGSKSSSMELTALSVDMKVAIEQMREQVQNIE